MHSSFQVIHKVGNVGIFVLFKFENTLIREIKYFNFNSKHHDKCEFSLKFIWVSTVSNLFPLEVIQKVNIANFVFYGKTQLKSHSKLSCTILFSSPVSNSTAQ